VNGNADAATLLEVSDDDDDETASWVPSDATERISRGDEGAAASWRYCLDEIHNRIVNNQQDELVWGGYYPACGLWMLFFLMETRGFRQARYYISREAPRHALPGTST
jgi:hypothetical protein